MSFVNWYNFTFSFSIRMLVISFSWLIVLSRTFSIMVNRSHKSGHSCPVPDFKRKVFNISQLTSQILTVTVSHMAFVMSIFLLFLVCCGLFHFLFICYKSVYNFVKCFLWKTWDDNVVFIIHSVNVIYYVIDFHISIMVILKSLRII